MGSTPTCDLATHTCRCRRPDPGNLLINASFDVDLAGWGGVVANVEPIWSNDDSDVCAGSGSVHGENTDGAPFQCVPVSGTTRYFFGAKFKSVNNFQDCEMSFYTNADCTGLISVPATIIALPAGGPNWTPVSATVTTPANALGAFVSCFLFQGNMDQIYLNSNVNGF
jgi:hypothetical protein